VSRYTRYHRARASRSAGFCLPWHLQRPVPCRRRWPGVGPVPSRAGGNMGGDAHDGSGQPGSQFCNVPGRRGQNAGKGLFPSWLDSLLAGSNDVRVVAMAIMCSATCKRREMVSVILFRAAGWSPFDLLPGCIVRDQLPVMGISNRNSLCPPVANLFADPIKHPGKKVVTCECAG
jgi:hypothetical protein